MESLAARFRETARKIPRGATLVAASKTQPVEAIEALYHLGHRDFGENYVQELVSKAKALSDKGCGEIRWHFIGHLQTNKVKQLVPWVSCVHSVDSLRLAEELSKRWKASSRSGMLPIFLEVNQDAEESKSGVLPREARALAQQVAGLGGLELLGLMSIPAPTDPERVQAKFRDLRELEEKCRPFTQGKLSMGMSADFEQAIAEGATHVRVGMGIFGSRPVRLP